MKKKITAIALAVCILAVGIVGATMSYFTDQETKTNTFTFGKVAIDLTETSTASDGVKAGTEKDDGSGYEYDKVLPGLVYSKEPTVTMKDDSADAYVVVTATLPAVYDFEGLFGGIDSSADVEHYINGDTATYVFYYPEALSAGESVTPFKTVTVNPALGDDAQGKVFDVDVNAYAIQEDAFGDVHAAFNGAFGDVREGFGLPFEIEKFGTTAIITKDEAGKVQKATLTNPDGTIVVKVPGEAIDETATELKLSIEPTTDGTVTAEADDSAASYEIKVTGLKDGNTKPLNVSFYVGKNAAEVRVYHTGTLITDATYDRATGFVSFEINNFCPFTVLYKAPVASIGEKNYGSLQAAVDAAKAGETIVLGKDIELDSSIFVAEGKSFTLNGDTKTITLNANALLDNAGKDGYNLSGLGKNANVTVKNVVLDSKCNQFAAITAVAPREQGALVLKFDGCTFENMYSAVYVNSYKDGDSVDLAITNCKFVNCNWGYSMEKPATVTFTKNTGLAFDKYAEIFPEKNGAYINGEFKQFDSLNDAISAAEAGDIVVLSSEEPIELPTSLPAGVTFKGNGDTVIACPESSCFKVNSEGIKFEDLTLDLGNVQGTDGAINVTKKAEFVNVTFTYDETSPKYAVNVSGAEDVSFINCKFEMNGKTRGIMVWGGNPTITIDGCYFDCVYPFNVDGGTPTFVVTNSELNGWTSYGGNTTASFENCKFGQSTSGYAFCRPYSDTVFTNCEFSSDFKVDFGAAGMTITMNGCKQNGVTVTTAIVEPSIQASGTLVIDGDSTPFTK